MRSRLVVFVSALLAVLTAAAGAPPTCADPLRGPLKRVIPADPAVTDPAPAPPEDEYVARLAQVTIQSGGAAMFGAMYVAAGKGPNPTALFLNGYPGHEENADLAQAARRAGWNVLIFHYRGTWGSEGSFSIPNALLDVGTALEFLRGHLALLNYRVDTSRIALVGHSMGGFLALMAGGKDPAVDCIAAISPVNLGQRGRELEANPEGAAAFAARLKGDSSLVKGWTPAEAIEHFIANKDAYDLPGHAEELSGKTLLLVGGKRDGMAPMDKHLDPLAKALQERNAPRFTEAVFDTDHNYSDHRIALARAMTSWLNEKCLAPRVPQSQPHPTGAVSTPPAPASAP